MVISIVLTIIILYLLSLIAALGYYFILLESSASKIALMLIDIALTILLINLIVFDIVYIISNEVLFASISWHINLLQVPFYCIIFNHLDEINTTKLMYFLTFNIMPLEYSCT